MGRLPVHLRATSVLTDTIDRAPVELFLWFLLLLVPVAVLAAGVDTYPKYRRGKQTLATFADARAKRWGLAEEIQTGEVRTKKGWLGFEWFQELTVVP